MQSVPGVRSVEGLPATLRLQVNGTTGPHPGRHIGNRVVDEVSVPGAGNMHGLVEVHRVRRINRDKPDVGQVGVSQRGVIPAGHDLVHLAQHLGGIVAGHVQFVAQAIEGCPQRFRKFRRDMELN